MKCLLAASLTVLAIGSGSALAADLRMPVKAPMAPPAPVASWTGCYVDAGAGYGFWNQEHYEFSNATGAIETATTTNGGRGWLGRFGGGCDFQFGSSWVIGAFGEYDFQDLTGTLSGIGVNGGIPAFANEKESSAWYAGGRLGYLITPTLLGYVDGGWTQTRFDAMTFGPETLTPLRTPVGLAAHTYDGWFLGGGYEYALNFSWLPIHGLFWRTEYRYAQYDGANLGIIDLNTGALGTSSINSKKEVQTITSSLVWRFNFGGPIAPRY